MNLLKMLSSMFFKNKYYQLKKENKQLKQTINKLEDILFN